MEKKTYLFYSPFHSFIHKVLVTAHECGLWDDIERVPTFPFKNNDGEDVSGHYSIDALNPLGKVPTLATSDGAILFGSQTICEYLDSRTTARRMFPLPGHARWDALTRVALADSIFEMTVQMVAEQWNPPEHWRMETFAWLWPKIDRGCDRLEEQAARGWIEFDVGHAAILHALSYIGFRSEFYPAKDPLRPHYDWREGRPVLSAWYDEEIMRPSVRAHYKQVLHDDKSAAYHQRVVAEVLTRRRAQGIAR